MIKGFYISGQTINLYDSKRHRKFSGVLYCNHQICTPAPSYKLPIVLFILSMVGFIWLAIPAVLSEALSVVARQQSSKYTDSAVYNSTVMVKNPDMQAEEMKDFKILIPQIGLESKVVPNVNPNNQEEYQLKLQEGIAHANGSYLPGEKGLVYLFSHSADSVQNILSFKARFYAVKDLVPGDEIFLFYNGKKYRYLVDSKFTAKPDDVDLIRNSKADLILQTCWPPGTDWERLVISAKVAS